MAKRLGFVLLMVVVLIVLAPIAQAQDFKVVVNVSNSMDSISPKALSGLFLKKDLTWPDGRAVVAVDLGPDSPTRAAFTEQIHGKKVSSIKSYWQRQIFAGKAVPPMELETDAEVLAYVAVKQGAVGYVSSTSPLRAKVKELAVEK